MRPVVSVEEMQAADAAALQHVDQATLVRRAGSAVALGALKELGGGYGHRVVVIAGKGNNGADGRVAAAILSRRGARVQVIDAASPGRLPSCDLVIDAAYGTGFRGRYEAPRVPVGAKVIAVDIPSGVNGDTGAVSGAAMRANRTVTMAALKAGLLQGDGSALAGRVEVAEIGIDVARSQIALVEDGDVRDLLPRRTTGAHKWSSAICVVAGSPGMEGAAVLVARGASHAGAGMVRLAVPEAPSSEEPAPSTTSWPLEAVRVPLEKKKWADEVAPLLKRCRALVIGPGLGRSERTQREVLRLIEGAEIPVIADADALFALGGPVEIRRLTKGANRPIVLTPHDGEYKSLLGEAPGDDRIAAARRLADKTGAVVLLKGPLTVVASPGDGEHRDGRASTLLAAAGTARLATAGTGDVLSGVIGAFVARGLSPGLAASLAAHVHGRAAASGPAEGLVAGDLPDLIASWLTRETRDGQGG